MQLFNWNKWNKNQLIFIDKMPFQENNQTKLNKNEAFWRQLDFK